MNKGFSHVLLLIIITFACLGVVVYIQEGGRAPSISMDPVNEIEKVISEPIRIVEKMKVSTNVVPNVVLQSGFSFYLPTEWEGIISDNTKDHFQGRFIIPNVEKSVTYVEIESFKADKYKVNPLIKVINENEVEVNDLVVQVIQANENFKDSNRKIVQWLYRSNSSVLALTLYYDDKDQEVVKSFNNLASTVKTTTNVTSSNWKFINKVNAQTSIAGFAADEFQTIDVMGDPLPERITSNDKQYIDGYAKLYKFKAFKGQRLTAVAMEDKSTNQGSFIRSEIYDENNRELISADTRLEFVAQYTGTYYYIIRTFNNQEGAILLKVFDRNQTENIVYLKYPNGSEVLRDPSSRVIKYGESIAAVIVQFINPVEVINDSTVRYFGESKEFEPSLGLITSPLQFYSLKQNLDEFYSQGSALPESSNNNLLDTKITKLSPSKLMVDMILGENFPSLSHIAIYEKSMGINRFFTFN